MSTFYELAYDPKLILQSPDFKVLTAEQVDSPSTKQENIACAYTEKHELLMIKKPMPKPRKGEVIVHVKASGICGVSGRDLFWCTRNLVGS